jgi:peptide deformylase
MKETNLEIKLFGNPILRKKSRPLAKITYEERDILAKMAQLMYEKGGIGLAANQVGIDRCLIVVDVGDGLYKLVNPRIIKKEGTQVLEEGCLSVPSACIKVKRAAKVWIEALNEEGIELNLAAEGLFACCLQHEIDHLKGRLILDYAALLKRLKIKKAIAQMRKKERDGKLPESKTKSCQLQL